MPALSDHVPSSGARSLGQARRWLMAQARSALLKAGTH